MPKRALIPLACLVMMVCALNGSEGVDPLTRIDWGQWGLAGVVTGVTMYLSWLREKRMSSALEVQQKWIQDELVSVLKRVADAPCQRERERE